MPLSPVRYVVPAADVAVAIVRPPAAALAGALADAPPPAADGDGVAPLLHAPTISARPNAGARRRASTRARGVGLDIVIKTLRCGSTDTGWYVAKAQVVSRDRCALAGARASAKRRPRARATQRPGRRRRRAR